MKNIIKETMRIRYENREGREPFFDFLKGCAMLLVLVHHSRIPHGEYILAFHMPLFFVISGYMRRVLAGGGVLKKKFLPYLKSRLMRLIVPYLLFELINLVIYYAFCYITRSDCPSIAKAIQSILLCINNDYIGLFGRLWFIPCAFITDIYVYVILNCFRSKRYLVASSCLICFFSSYVITSILHIRLPFTLDTALMAAGYYLLGWLLSGVISWLIKDENIILKLFIAFLAAIYLFVAVKYLNASTLMYINQYGNYIFSITAAIAGCVMFFVSASCVWKVLNNIEHIKDYFLWYGVNSLVVFPVHLFIKVSFIKVMGSYALWYFLLITMLILTIPAVNFLTRSFPILSGAGLQKKSE